MGPYTSEMDWQGNIPIRKRSAEEMIVELQTKVALLELRLTKLEGRSGHVR